uniref:Uncharacterized protein n=1 Tax=uncultured prokaryote TaxID=198431 RepID=A0A0H5Q0I4_9ZZZZ|nr:hypothetical protein [uncultured prokaryote]
MAIINSVVVGRGRKSVGEITLRYERGRTIATRRIYENKSNTAMQSAQRTTFTEIIKALSNIPNNIMTLLAVKSRYGSQRNNYYKNAKVWLQSGAELARPELGRQVTTINDVMSGLSVNGELVGNTSGNVVVGNVAYNGNSASVNESGLLETNVFLNDVKDISIDNVTVQYVYISLTNFGSDENRELRISPPDQTKATLGAITELVQAGKMAVMIGDNDTIIVRLSSGYAGNRKFTNYDDQGMMLSNSKYLFVPIIRWRTTKDEDKVMTIPLNVATLYDTYKAT